MIQPHELDPAAVEAASAMRSYDPDLDLTAEQIAAYLNHVYEDDEAMRRSYHAAWAAHGRPDAERGRASFLAAARGGEASCDEPVWDGPYKMRCGYVLVNGECVRHGKRGR